MTPIAQNKFLAAPITITYAGSSKKSKYVQQVKEKYQEGAYMGADRHLGVKFSSWELVGNNKTIFLAKEDDEKRDARAGGKMGAKTK